jgi:hypothetical protein
MNTEKEKQMESTYRAVVGLTYPSTPEGYKQAIAAQTEEDYAAITWARSEPGEPVPDYVIKASPWLVEQAKVEKGQSLAPKPVAKPAPPAPVEKKEG